MKVQVNSSFFSRLSVKTFALCVLFSVGCSGFSVTGGPGETISPLLRRTVTDQNGLRALGRVKVSPIEVADQESLDAAQVTRFEQILSSNVKSTVLIRVIDADQKEKPANDLATLSFRVVDVRQRKGGEWGADEPARVSLESEIKRSADSKVLWAASYRMAEQGLSDNLFKLKNTQKFHTAEELFETGISQLMADFENARRSSFN